MKERYSWAKVCACGENKRRADYGVDPATRQLTPVWVCINCNKETPRRLPKFMTEPQHPAINVVSKYDVEQDRHRLNIDALLYSDVVKEPKQ